MNNKFLELLKEKNESVYKKQRVKLISQFDLNEINEKLNGDFKQKNDIFNILSFLKEDGENLAEIMEAIEIYVNFNEEDREILECFLDYNNILNAVFKVKNEDYHYYYDKIHYIESFIYNTAGDLEQTLEETFGSFIGYFIFQSVDLKDLADETIKHSEGIYALSGGRVIDLCI
jgi:hypothetical protein